MQRTDVPWNTIPMKPGVYLFKTGGKQILYIGKAKQLKKRLQHYFTPSTLRKQDMVLKADHIEVLPVTNEEEALLLETSLIRTHRPIYNNLIKGESSYVYIKIPQEPYPNILLTRYKKNDRAVYVGPKVRKRELKQTLQLLRHLLQYRSCSPSVFAKGHVCSDYFFGLCAGRCAYHKQSTTPSNTQAGFVPQYTPAEAAEIYQRTIKSIIAYFTGATKPLEQLIQSHLDHAVSQQHFERAAKLRDIFLNLQSISQQQQVILDGQKTGIYCHIRKEGKRWLRGVIDITDGKIRDVLTGKEHVEDCDADTLLETIQREYTLPLTTLPISSSTHILAYGTTKHSFTKKELKTLHEHMERFLEGFRNSQHTSSLQLDGSKLVTLQQRYHLPQLPQTIECIDISHFGGDWTAGAVSCLVYGEPQKTRYRQYKLTPASKGDDYAALAEVLITRIQSKDPLPDLLLIDGGVGQLGVVKTLLTQDPVFAERTSHVSFASLEKGAARKRAGKRSGNTEIFHYLDRTGNISSTPLQYDDIDKILVLARDEAHRFANAYRKKRMKSDF